MNRHTNIAPLSAMATFTLEIGVNNCQRVRRVQSYGSIRARVIGIRVGEPFADGLQVGWSVSPLFSRRSGRIEDVIAIHLYGEFLALCERMKGLSSKALSKTPYLVGGDTFHNALQC
jgi:hypothetical protein